MQDDSSSRPAPAGRRGKGSVEHSSTKVDGLWNSLLVFSLYCNVYALTDPLQLLPFLDNIQQFVKTLGKRLKEYISGWSLSKT